MPDADEVQSPVTRGATRPALSGDPGIAVNPDASPSLSEPAELRDHDLQCEIELVTELVLAASASVGPLSDAEIDLALGLPSN
jgi:hypothetical protein